jgi:hypothetical protein
VIFGCAFQISGMAEPQYIYAYLRNDSNYTEANTTTKHVSKECLNISSTSSDDRIKGLASEWCVKRTGKSKYTTRNNVKI